MKLGLAEMSYRMQSRPTTRGWDDKAGGDSVARIQDKISEIQGKLTLKMRDQEAYYVFSQQQIKDNDDLIKSLRTEIHEKRILRKKRLSGDLQVISEGFKNDKESQLAMRRYTAEKAVKEKNEHVFEKVKILNNLKHERNKKLQRKKELADILEDAKANAKLIAETDYDQRSRVLMTSIEKMRLKYSSASYIQKTYRKILRHLGEDNRQWPKRLRALEQSIQENRNELNGTWYQIQLDARKAYENTKFVKEKMEERIHREKRQRDSNLAEVRRRFKKMNQKDDEKLNKRRATGRTPAAKRERKPSISFWENIRQFWKVKRSLDSLRESMSLSHPNDIAIFFQRQISRKKEMEQAVKDLTVLKETRQKELNYLQSQLATVAAKHGAKVEDATIETTAIFNAVMQLAAETETKKNRVSDVNEILIDATLAIRSIQRRISTCDWIPKLISQRHGHANRIPSIVSSTDIAGMFNNDDIIEILQVCEEKLCLMSQAKDDEEFQMIASDFPSDEAKETLVAVTACTPFNRRICIADEDDLADGDTFFEDDDDHNDQYLSRESIKSTYEEVMELQQSKKGK